MRFFLKMTKDKQLKLLWKSHDFYLKQVYDAENSFNLFFKNIKRLANRGEIESGFSDLARLNVELVKVFNKVDCFLKKHIHCVNELIAFYKKHPDSIPSHLELDEDIFVLLRKTTEELRVSYNEAFLVLSDILS